MRPGVSSGERQGYVTALAGLWSGLSLTLTRLEALAADPDETLADDDALETLPRLQYALHSAGELAAGIEPPPGAEVAHAELAEALADARDATAEVVEALEAGGPEAVEPLVHEWRGTLFSVRLARLRLNAREAAPLPGGGGRLGAGTGPAALAVLLVVAGALTFAAGARAAFWPAWTAGILLLMGGFFVYRP